MRTRILILIGIIGLAIIWFGMQQSDRFLTMIGIGSVGIGFIGAYFSARSKKGFKFFRWF